MRKKIALALLLVLNGAVSLPFGKGRGWISLLAQNEIDALRYSQIRYGGTARFTAMSEAFGALGGDFSVLSTNPAGIAIFRRSEFTFTPSFFNQKTSSNFKGNQLDDYAYNVNFNNAGIVLSYYEPETKNAWKGVMFGFGYNRTNNFWNRISMAGKNTSSSLLDVFVADAVASGGDTNAMDPFGTQLSLNTFAIWKDTADGNFYHHLQTIYGEQQNKSVTTRGSMGETVFTLGGNYSDKLYMGVTLGIPHIRYDEEFTYIETADSSLNGFHSFELNQSLRTTGVGFNFKFGIIYRLTDWVRVGGALHFPSYFNMHDNWSSNAITTFKNPNQSFSAKSPTGLFDYSLITPIRTMMSVGFVIKKMGLIGADYEFVDYSSATLRSAKYKYLNENRAIREKYTEANNIRIGTEWKIHPLSIRGGFAYYSSPYKRGSGNNGSRIDYSAGIGFREENFFLDFAFVYSQIKENYYFYKVPSIDPSVNTSTNISALMTLGFKF
jgi:hypothetical protein